MNIDQECVCMGDDHFNGTMCPVCDTCGKAMPESDDVSIGIQDWLRTCTTCSDCCRDALNWNMAIDSAIEVIPGGDICDPQEIADSIRALKK